MAYKDPKQSGEGGAPETEKSAFTTDGILYKIAPTPGKGNRLGTLQQIGEATPSYSGTKYRYSYRAPALARIGYVPTFGCPRTITDDINTSGLKFFKEVQNALKKTNLPFDWVSIMLNLMAQDSLRIAYNTIKLLYNASITHNVYNKHIPTAIFNAAHTSLTDWVNNGPRIYRKLTKWAEALNSYPLPMVFDMFAVHKQMSQGLFADRQDDKAQLYMFYPEAVLSYDTVDTTLNMSWAPTPDSDEETLWADWESWFENLLAAVMSSDDFSTINSAFLSTYGDTQLYEVSAGAETDTVSIYYTEDVLDALQNATFIGSGRSAYDSLLVQDTGNNYMALKNDGVLTQSKAARISTDLSQRLINISKSEPTGSDMVNYMRWRVAVDPITRKFKAVGTEVLTSVVICNGTDLSFTEANRGVETVTPTSSVLTGDRIAMHCQLVVHSEPGNYDFIFGGSNLFAMNLVLTLSRAFKSFPILYVIYPNLQELGHITPTEEDVLNGNVVPVAEWKYVGSTDQDDLIAYADALIWKSLMNQ